MKKTLLMLALVAGITCFAQNAQAALIPINIGPSPGFNISGINGGGVLTAILLPLHFRFQVIVWISTIPMLASM